MKKIAVTDEKIPHIKKAFDHKKYSYTELRTSYTQPLEKGSQHGEEYSKNKILL